MNKSLSITIVCCNDQRIFKCIESIQKNDFFGLEFEIIVILVPNEAIKNKLKDIKGIKIAFAEKGNLSQSRNIGIKYSKYPLILFLDSDLILERNYLKKMIHVAKEDVIVKSNIEFKSDNFLSSVIAKSRKIGHLEKPYAPGIIISKKLFEKFGLFDENIFFSEDGELITRFQKNGISTLWVNDAIIFHPPISLKHDLMIAFKIGQGKRIGVEIGKLENEEDFKEFFKKMLKGAQVMYFAKIWEKWGLVVAIYEIIWYIFYYFGYYEKKYVKKKCFSYFSTSR